MNMLRLKKKKKKDPTKHWTYKVGSKLGAQIDKLFSNKRFTTVFIIVLLIILFDFIVPIKNNIVTLSLLAILLIISFIIKRKK